MKDIRIAVVISHSPVLKTDQNLEQMFIRIKAARRRGAALICFPELNITGYSVEKDIINSAVPIPGPITDKLQSWAESEHIAILAGMAEKGKKGRIFASHVAVKPDGRIGVYRKLHIAPPERSIFSPGSDIPIFETRGVKFGMQLCYDAHFPSLATTMALNGADILFYPHASPRKTPEDKFRSWMRHLPARAYDNSLFVVACNQVGENGKGLCFPGIGLIIDPSGNVQKKDISGKEGMIIADLKGAELKRVRENRMRFFLPNRRPELYRT